MRLATTSHEAHCHDCVCKAAPHPAIVTTWGFSAIVLPCGCLSTNKAATCPSKLCHLALCHADSRHQATLCFRFLTLIVVRITPLQALEQLSTTDAALHTCIALPVDGLVLLLTLPHRTATIFFPHCNVVKALSPLRSPSTVIGPPPTFSQMESLDHGRLLSFVVRLDLLELIQRRILTFLPATRSLVATM